MHLHLSNPGYLSLMQYLNHPLELIIRSLNLHDSLCPIIFNHYNYDIDLINCVSHISKELEEMRDFFLN